MSLLTIDEPVVPVQHPLWSATHPVWALGFRPFYILAAALSVLAVPLWLAQYMGWLKGMANVSLGWHMHEMVFGMAIAVIVGFLFTAARNWTGLPTPRGRHLAIAVFVKDSTADQTTREDTIARIARSVFDAWGRK